MCVYAYIHIGFTRTYVIRPPGSAAATVRMNTATISFFYSAVEPDSRIAVL